MGNQYMDDRKSALTVRFGRFFLDSHHRELLADGVPVSIGGRAFDVLIVLIEAGGQLVTKDELMCRVWPGRFVEENCVQFQISTLRKALGSDRDFIKTIAGRGYRFVADISADVAPEVAPFRQRGESGDSMGLPTAISDLIGRDAKFPGLADLVAAHRQATPGPASQSDLVLPAVAALLQLVGNGPATIDGIRAAFAPESLLLLLSIGALTVGRQDHAARTQEMLAA
jgi:DNA-binding winged helix-turn-helix (wHTH) protein